MQIRRPPAKMSDLPNKDTRVEFEVTQKLLAHYNGKLEHQTEETETAVAVY